MRRADPRDPKPTFVHLRLHTEYSLVDGIVRVPLLMQEVAAAGMPAVALTDQGNLFAMVKFYREAQRQGVKPVIGVDVWLREEGDRAEPSRLTLLAQNLAGYRNLTRLVSRSYLEGQDRGRPLFERAWLDEATTAGLIALSGAGEGDVGRALAAGRNEEARALLAAWLALFGDRYYLEVQRTGRAGEDDHVSAVLALVAEVPAPVVATNDVRFLAREAFEAHEARVCIHDGARLDDPGRPRRYSPEQYLKSPAEMAELFADLPESIANSVEIARRCSLALTLGRSYLPAFAVPDGSTVTEYLQVLAEQGLDRRLAAHLAAPALVIRPIEESRYRLRLAGELRVICEMGFEGYFLVVAGFIR